MKRSDYLFFGTLIIYLLLIMITFIFNIQLPWWTTLLYMVVLLPIGLIKTWWPNSKFAKWWNKEVKKAN